MGLYEWRVAGRDLDVFTAMDENGDGLLTAEECLKWQRMSAADRAKAESSAKSAPRVGSTGVTVKPTGDKSGKPGILLGPGGEKPVKPDKPGKGGDGPPKGEKPGKGEAPSFKGEGKDTSKLIPADKKK